MIRSAVISEDGMYRYELTRQWGLGPTVLWVLLNPSTADADVDDPTIRRCISFSRDWGFAGLTVINVFALRSTDPKALKGHPDPFGPLCARVGCGRIDQADMVVAAWGAHPMVPKQNWITNYCQATGKALRCLGTTKSGAPKHPLYVAGTQPLVVYP